MEVKQRPDRVLIVDDDEAVLSTLKKVVSADGMDATGASDGEAALEALRKNVFDLILMDVNMQGMNGFEVIKTIRNMGIRTPVIIVSGRKEEDDTLYGLDIGADDYVTKPFNPVILVAKIKATIRRSRSTEGSDPAIIAGPFSYDTSTLRLYKNGEEISLTQKENALMKLFIDNINRVFTKDILYDLVWGNAIVDENAIMVYINHLRQKIEDDPSSPRFIQTVRGLGYRFCV